MENGSTQYVPTDDDISELYLSVCDVVERTYQELPLDDDSGLKHTSNEARAAATRIFAIIRSWGDALDARALESLA